MTEERWREDRRAHLQGLFDFGSGAGLEIGPLHAPVVTKDVADVRYVDVFSREKLVETYRQDPLVDTDLIPPIEFVLSHDGRIRPLDQVVAGATPYAWVFASHVIEHVPDLIGWLQELARVVDQDGALVLAVPDRRYSFDVHRPQTTVGEMLHAHDRGDVVPSVRAVYDSNREKVEVDTAALWRGEPPPPREARVNTLDTVLAMVEQARAGEYVDAHVWTFTPESFSEQLAELARLGLCSWAVEQTDAPEGSVEFYVVLRRAGAS